MSRYKKIKLVEETAALAAHSRTMIKNEVAKIQGRDFVIYPTVFNPRIFFSSDWFAGEISALVKDEPDFCEVGCGTGVVSITVALESLRTKVTALDINAAAVANTQKNVFSYFLERRVRYQQSDVLNALSPNRQFDSIFWSMPFGYLEPEENADIVDLQTFDPGYRAIELFFKTGKTYLKKGGRLLIGFSEEIGTKELLNNLVKKYRYSLKLLAKQPGMEKSPVTMEILEAKPL
jgi:methylase of polypeptide subunit release factors